MKIGYKLLSPTATAPQVAHQGTMHNMGIDICCSEDIVLRSGRQTDKTHPHPSLLPYVNAPTGIALDLPEGVHVSWGGRSGLAFKEGILPFEGKIDASYRGEIMIKLWSMNLLDDGRVIPAGTKIAQLYIVHYQEEYQLVEVTEMSDTERGKGGFGSTDR